jgi:YD repeat-containing protein
MTLRLRPRAEKIRIAILVPAALALLTTAADATSLMDPILEWNGPNFRVLHAPAVDQLVDSPPPGSATPFSGPQGTAVREHGTGQRDVVYVLDTGNSRVQAFEVNGTRSTAHSGAFTWRTGGVTPAAGEFDSDQILLAQWKAVADRWIIPYSQTVEIDGVTWSRVDDLTGFSPANRVYTLTYDDASNAPEIRFPAGSLTQTTIFRLEYVLTDNQGMVPDAFGVGDVDFGISSNATKVPPTIDPASGGPDSWQTVRGITLTSQDAVDTSDDIFLLDAADNSVGQDQELFYYTISVAGAVTYREAYDDALTTPWGLAVARSGNSTAAAVVLSSDDGPFDLASGTIRDASQVTGHAYIVGVAGGNVTVSDRTTGRILVDAAPFGNLADPFLAIPGISLVKNGGPGTSITITTTRATPNRFLFVADTGANRVKVISAHGATPTAIDDWLPGDAHTSVHQPAGAGVGASATEDYYQSTPATVPPNWSAWTTTFPLAEGTLATVTLDPDGTPDAWSRTDDLSAAVPGEKVYEVDWQMGRVLFGDGTHGAIPPASTEIAFTYKTTPDLLRYGSVGAQAGQFASPKGIAARWNAALGQCDVYVADTGNNRVQKLAFVPTNEALNLPARLDYVCSWTAVAATGRALLTPMAVTVAADGQSPPRVWVGVADTGHDRIALYDDTAAATAGGTAAPAYLDSLGTAGAELGLFGELNGLSFLPHGNDLDLYAADRTRGVMMKFERAEVPSIALDLSGGSLLPACFPPSGAYTFRFTAANPPFDGYLDLYYGTAATFNPATAKLCVGASTVDAAASSAVWRFASSPAGAAAAGSYYLFVRMKDAVGTVVATAQTTAAQLLCLDAGIQPRVQGADAVDGDRTLYLQNGLDRVLTLQIAYPESVMAVGFSGVFDTSLVAVTGITQGNAWDGTGAVNQLFTPSWSNTAGTFRVNTSIVGSPWGLNGSGPFTLARVALRAKTTALKTTPLASRWKNGTITIAKATSGITMRGGASPASWTTRSMNLRFGWLGDIATTASGADSIAPHLMPKPDGKIDFADQMAFTVGWNGAQFVQDPIADLGPVEGTAPSLHANPDGRWDIEDILAFTTMYSWASSLGFSKESTLGDDGDVGDVGNDGDGGGAGAGPRRHGPRSDGQPWGSSPLDGLAGTTSRSGKSGKSGNAWARTLSHAGDPRAGGELVVDLLVENALDLTGASFALTYDPDQLELVSLESAGLLEGAEGSLFLHRESSGYLEASISRLDRGDPGVDGSGTAARATFRIRHPQGAPLSLSYDLRSSRGERIGAGTWCAGAFTGEAAPFTLFPAWPNPARETTRLLFSLDGDRAVSLQVFDAAGRRVRSLVDGMLPPGYHAVPFDMHDDTGVRLPSGVYFFRLGSDGRAATGRVVLTR